MQIAEKDSVTLNNGITLPRIGFGTDYLKGEECINAVIKAIETGYRLIDTAAIYGNEKEIGIAVRTCIERGIIKRSDILIQTKTNWFLPKYEDVLQTFNESLENFGLEYIDIYMIHHAFDNSFTQRDDIIESWKALETLYASGKVKTIGICNFDRWALDILFRIAKVRPAINQLEIHPQHQQKELVEFCKKENIFIQAWGSLNKGRMFKIKLFSDLAEKYGKTPAQIALRWSYQKGFSYLARSKNEKHIEGNFNISDVEISSEDMQLLDSLDGGEFSGHHVNNITPIGKMAMETFCNLYDFVQNRKNSIIQYKLFGFIPFFKIKKQGRITNCYLFGIRILKIDNKRI